MLSFLRAPTPPRTNNASNNPIAYEDGRSSVHFRAPSSKFIMTHVLPPTTAEHGVSIIQPPFHYHIHQAEYFNVQSGSGNFWMGTDKTPFAKLDKSKPHASIPASRYHRFENASQTEDFVLDIQLAPEDYENEQRFFRNFFGYLDDCKKSKTEPSIFQLMVFLHSADTPLALPAPGGVEVIGVWISRAFMIAMAAVGRSMGYKQSYEEYYVEKKAL